MHLLSCVLICMEEYGRKFVDGSNAVPSFLKSEVKKSAAGKE